MKRVMALLLLCWLALPAHSAEDVYPFAQPEHHDRFRALTVQLRCPKCQNQAIADSDAPIAMDMRDHVADLIRAGLSDDEIVDYFVHRYGDFVSYHPPLTPQTLILWLAPVSALLLGLLLVLFQIRRARRIARGEDIL